VSEREREEMREEVRSSSGAVPEPQFAVVRSSSPPPTPVARYGLGFPPPGGRFAAAVVERIETKSWVFWEHDSTKT
jgi:hypothetical protein